MAVETLLFIVLVALVVGAVPAWPYSRSWGYAPTHGLYRRQETFGALDSAV